MDRKEAAKVSCLVANVSNTCITILVLYFSLKVNMLGGRAFWRSAY